MCVHVLCTQMATGESPGPSGDDLLRGIRASVRNEASKRKSFIHFSSDRGNNSTNFSPFCFLLPSLAARMRPYSTPLDETSIETKKNTKKALLFYLFFPAVSPPRTGSRVLQANKGASLPPLDEYVDSPKPCPPICLCVPSEAAHHIRSEAAM